MFYNQQPFGQQHPFGQRLSFKAVLKRFFTQKSILNRLIIINVSVYVLYLLLNLVFSLFGFLFQSNFNEKLMETIVRALSMPADFHRFIYQPWSIVTSIFLHVDFFHIFFNMLMLFVLGRIFTQYLNEKRLLVTYLVGGVFGNILYMLAYNFFPVFEKDLPVSIALGASGGIMAIMGAIAVYAPNHIVRLLIFGKTKLYWITLIFLVIDLISIPKGNAGGHIAHLGGALYGAFAGLLYMKKFSLSTPKKKKKQKFYVSYESARPVSDEEYNAQKVEHQKRLDAILDKISKSGYDALTKEEKDFLFSAGKK